MISLILQCTIGFILVYRVYKYMYTKPANSPPGIYRHTIKEKVFGLLQRTLVYLFI